MMLTKRRILTRHEWDCPPIADNHTVREVASIVEANIHHSDSVPPRKHRECFGVVLGFDSFHRSKGWACIGYNRVICSHGYVFLGRPLTVTPAAADGHNTPIIGYCLIAKGNDRMTWRQRRTLRAMIRRDEGRLGRKLKLTTHREVEPPGYTECPGDGIEGQVKKWRKAA